MTRFCTGRGAIFSTGGSFRKGVRVPTGVPEKGFWGQVQVTEVGGGGAVFPGKVKEKGQGVGRVGVGVG